MVEEKLKDLGIEVIGTIPYDRSLVEADLSGKAPIDVGGPAVEEIKKIKQRLQEMFEKDVQVSCFGKRAIDAMP